ncbi:D-inositol 3-phosphate glycosyltransferase [compost metagenome]
MLNKWTGNENYARLGTSLAVLDWNEDGCIDIAAGSHNYDPNGMERNGRVTIFSGKDQQVLHTISGVNNEGLGVSLAAGDVNGDGKPELVIGAPRFNPGEAALSGRILIYSRDHGLIYELTGNKAYDEFGHKILLQDMDGDGTEDLIIASPKTGGKYVWGGHIKIYSIALCKALMEKEGWFGLQELGTDVLPVTGLAMGPCVLAGSRVGSVYLLDMKGKVVHEFNGDEEELFGQAISMVRTGGDLHIAVGAVSARNRNKFMSGCVYFLTSTRPIETVPKEIFSPVSVQSAAGSNCFAKKKILLATYWYLPHVGGVDVYVKLLKEELEKDGHQVDVLAHHPDMAHYYLVDGDKMINKWQIKNVVYDKVLQFYRRYLSHVDPWVRYREVERYCFELAAVLFDLGQYDVIHTQDIISTRALSRVKPARTALVATIHGLLAKEHLFSGDIEGKESLAWKYVADEEYYGCISADATIVPTNWLVREMVRFTVPPELFDIIPYGLNIDAFHKKSNLPLAEPFNNKGSFTICCPARLVPVKGHTTLISALKRLIHDDRWHCLLAGDGPLQTEIKEMIQRHGLQDRITMLGDRKDVPALLRQSDAVVLPSLQDNLPFSIMESQLSGVPVIASNAGGIPEMISHQKTGLLFDSGDDEQLARQISVLLNDAGLRTRLASEALQWAGKHWSSDTLLKRTLGVYNKALAKVRGEGEKHDLFL